MYMYSILTCIGILSRTYNLLHVYNFASNNIFFLRALATDPEKNTGPCTVFLCIYLRGVEKEEAARLSSLCCAVGVRGCVIARALTVPQSALNGPNYTMVINGTVWFLPSLCAVRTH